MFAFLGRAVLTVGTLAAGSYAVYKGGSKLITDAEILHSNLQILMEEQIVQQQNYQEVYHRLPDQTKAVMSTFLPLLRARLLELCDLNSLIKELKQLQSMQTTQRTRPQESTPESSIPQEDTTNEEIMKKTKNDHEDSNDEERKRQKKVAELWEEVKIRSITRLLTTIGTIVTLTALVQIHFALLGRITGNGREHYIQTNLNAATGSSSLVSNVHSSMQRTIPVVTNETTTSTSLSSSTVSNNDDRDQRAEQSYEEELKEELGKRYDHILQLRQKQSLELLINTLFTYGIPNLVKYIQQTITLLLSTPAYRILVDDTTTSGPTLTTITGHHVLSLFQTLLSAIEPQFTSSLSSEGNLSSLFPPSKVLELLLPHDLPVTISEGLTSVVSSIGSSSSTTSTTTTIPASTSTGSSISVQDLINLARSKVSQINEQLAQNPIIREFVPIPWTAQILTNMTIDVLRSPGTQAYLRNGIIEFYLKKVQDILNDKVLTKGKEFQYPLGPLMVSLRFATDAILINNDANEPSTSFELRLHKGSRPPSEVDPIEYLCQLPRLNDLCYQIMFNAKLN